MRTTSGLPRKPWTENHSLSKLATESTLKKKQPGKWDLKWRPGYRIVHIEHDGHYLHIVNQATGKTIIMQQQECST